jgi:hypothetical protein
MASFLAILRGFQSLTTERYSLRNVAISGKMLQHEGVFVPGILVNMFKIEVKLCA